MISRFKSAMNQIKAEDALINRTEGFLKDALMNTNTNNIKNSHWRSLFMKKKLVAAACMATLIVGGSGAAYAYYQTPVSYLSMDINPSVEIGVNAFDKVVKVKGINDDGNKILAKVDIKGSNVTVAVNMLVTSAVYGGYIADDGSSVVSLTSETDDSTTAAELENDAETGANQALEETDKTATVIKDNVALARREQARALGISPGKLNLINKLQKVDPTATVDEYKDASVKAIMKTIKDSKDSKDSEDKLKNNADHKDENKDQTNSTADTNTTTSTNTSTTTGSTTTGNAVDSSDANKSNAAKENNASKANEKEDKVSNEDKASKDNNAATVTNKSKEDKDDNKNDVKNQNQSATKSNAAAQENKNGDVNKNSNAKDQKEDK
ncbi:hypothetical protein [Paenibacillus sp. DMB5]|uniref:anti-sigma-I factor RsgI family protein n=1 Tax=Paenibacillus sp. DMB5 TaxID=1780103 RepID=UPI00076CCF79|nr:hypothetical protein [Paenibacillus sp. DMB5]KUP22096.1 hypothetical protein AWJ19_21550 [Paenibacillus sp. DMB5]